MKPFSDKALVELMQATLDKGATFRFQAKGLSMSPFIRNGDFITISPLSSKQKIFGQAVAFLRPGAEKLVVHRVISKSKDYYLVKGDSLFFPDGIIPQENLLGFVSQVERKGRKVRLGLGPERIAIVFLSRHKILPLLVRSWRILPTGLRKIIKPLL